MERKQYRQGQTWAYRRTKTIGEDAVKVKVLDYPKGVRKVKIQHVDGELAGLDEWVNPATLISPWKDWPKRLRAERRELDLRQHVLTVVGMPDTTTADAISLVFDSSGEQIWLDERYGVVTGEAAEFERLASRAGWTSEDTARLTTHPATHDYRFPSRWRIPWDRGHQLAVALAKAEPETVSMYIDGEKTDLKHRGYLAGERWAHDYLREQLPAMALAREWAGGHDERAETLERRIGQLEQLLEQAADVLARHGEDRLAGRLRRARRAASIS